MELRLHKNQYQLFQRQDEILSIVAGRGFGKSVLLRAKLIAAALTYDTSLYTDPDAKKAVMLIMSDRVSCQSLHWEAIKTMLEGCPLVEKIDNRDLKITLADNRPSIILRGADEDGKRLRGFDLVWAGVDEAQNFPDVGEVIDKILRPALTRNPKWSCWVIGTPDGELSPFHRFCMRYGYAHFTSWDNPLYSRLELRKMQRNMPPKTYAQEILAEWVAGSLQVFPSFDPLNVPDADKLAELEPKARYLGIDWGDTNPALVVVDLSTDTLHSRYWKAIAEWHNESGEPVAGEDFTNLILEFAQKYQVFRICAPDDRPSMVRTLIRKGCRNIIVVPRNKPTPMDRRSKLDSLFHRSRLDISDCPNLQSEVTRLRYKSIADPVIPKTLPDHLVDALGHSVGYLEIKLEEQAKDN